MVSTAVIAAILIAFCYASFSDAAPHRIADAHYLLADKGTQRTKRDFLSVLDDGFSEQKEADRETEDDDVPKLQIRGLRVTSSVTARFAKTVVVSHVVNPTNQSQEVNFYMELPTDAFISGFLIKTEGEIYHSRVDEKAKAQEAYDQAIRKGQTAGQVKQVSEKKNDFAISINVANGSSLSFNMTYEELLKRRGGYFENAISITPGQIVRHLIVDVYINEPQGLDEEAVEYFVKTHESDGSSQTKLPPWMTLESLKDGQAHLRFNPSPEEQRLLSEDGGNLGKFVTRYDVIHGHDGGAITIVNGYFVHHFSPDGFKPTRKNVIFVLDTSGSMSGTKIRQTKEAMLTILSQLLEKDHFGVVTFSSRTESWRPELAPATAKNVKLARRYIADLDAQGGTNLHGGIVDAISMLDRVTENVPGTYPVIVMLTDGQPTSGVMTTPEAITTDIRQRIEGRYSLFCLGFGSGVNYPLLEKLSLQNGGLARKIYEDSDAGLQLVGFFDEVATPLLVNINMQYDNNDIVVNSISQTSFPSYFEGTELVIAGHLRNDVNNSLPSILTCIIVAETQNGTVELELEANVKQVSDVMLSPHAVDDFAQRLWAFLTIKELLRKRIAAPNPDEKANITQMALELSLKYHFVTPLTSLVVVKPDEEVLAGEDPPPVPPNRGRHYQSQPSRGHHVRGTGIQQAPIASISHGLAPVAYDPAHFLLAFPQATFAPTHRYTHPTRKHVYSTSQTSVTPSTSSAPSTSSTKPTTPTSSTPLMSSVTVTTDVATSSSPASGKPLIATEAVSFLLQSTSAGVTFCFDVNVQPNSMMMLINDPATGVSVRGRVVKSAKRKDLPPVFEFLVLTLPNGYTVTVSPSTVTIDQSSSVDWDMVGSIVIEGTAMSTRGDGRALVVQVMPDIALTFTRGDRALNGRDSLGVYVSDGDGFSDSVGGYIGKFVRKTIRPSRNSQGHTTLQVEQLQLEVTPSVRMDIRDDHLTPCWYADDVEALMAV